MADGHPVLNEPVLVRRGLRLDECVTETCLAVKVLKRFASETLKLVGPLRGVSNFVCYFPIFPEQMTVSRRRSPSVLEPASTPDIASGCAISMMTTFWCFWDPRN